MKKNLTVIMAIIGLLTFSGLAMAANEDEPEQEPVEDTVFNFGYDEQHRILIWGASPSDSETDCTLEGETAVTYGAVEDGAVEVPLFEADSDCQVSGTSVEGPNGQVNHGMFMKAFNQVYQGPGRGCLVKFLAQTDFGKGDQQIVVADVDPEAPEVAEGDTGTVDFTSVLADCEHGKKGNGDEADEGGSLQEPGAEGKANAAEKKAEKASGTHGNSANAPGHNK